MARAMQTSESGVWNLVEDSKLDSTSFSQGHRIMARSLETRLPLGIHIINVPFSILSVGVSLRLPSENARLECKNPPFDQISYNLW
jgi:hypothetical protein